MVCFREAFMKLKNGNDVRGAFIATEEEKQTFTPELAAWIAKAFAAFLAGKEKKQAGQLRIGIGHDSRVSAPQLKAAGITGLSGCTVYDCGLITTPAMFQSVILPDSSFDGAIMLTASHLPFNRNGMKFFTKSGALSSAELTGILDCAVKMAEEYADQHGTETLLMPDAAGGKEPVQFDMKGVYCAHMRALIKENTHSADQDAPLKGLHILVDSGNGASGFFATDILEALGADISGSQFLEPDGMFPNHVPNPENKDAMASVREAVLKAGADLGVIFDCDGDRAAVVFSDGTEVNRNALIALLAVIVSEKAPGSWVVTDSVTSDELGVFLTEKLGMKHLRFKRGYKNVIDRGIKLNERGERCELAIETSGHGAFKENHFSDDGAYIALKIICRMADLMQEGKRIEDLTADLKSPAEAREIRYKITETDFAAYGKQVLEDFRTFCESAPEFEIVEPNYEGIRVNYDIEGMTGWVLLRMSLHDPVMPMNLESSVSGGCEAVMAMLKNFFDQKTALR